MDPRIEDLIASFRQLRDKWRQEDKQRIASFAKRQSVELPNRGNGNLNLEKEESSSVETKCCAKPKKCDPQIWSKDNIKRALKMRGITTMEKRRAKKRGRVANKVQFQREINFDLKVQEKIQETVIVARINRGRTLFDHHRNNGGKRLVMEKRKTRVFAKPSRFSFFSFDPGGVSKDTVYALSGSIAILMGRAQNTLGKVKMKDSESRLWNPTRNWCKPDPNAQGRNAPLPSSWLCSAAPLFPSLRRTSLPSRAWPFACSTAIHKHFRNCPKRKVILSRRKGNYAILPKVSCEINNPVRVFGFRNQQSRFLFASSAPNLRTDSLSAGFRIGMVLKKKKRVSLFLTSAGSLTLIMGWLLMKPPWSEPFRLLNTETVILYPVSTRSALEAKLMESSSFRDLNGELSVIGSQYGASSFYEFEKFLYSFLDGSTIPGMDRMRLKLETPVGIAEKLISGCGTLVTQDYRSAKQDLTAINDVINSVNESALNMETESLSWRRQTISLIEKFSSSSASKSFEQEVREMILGTFGQLGVAGFSASLLTSVLQTTMEDLLALGICSVGGYLAISKFPARRQSVIDKVKRKADSLAFELEEAMKRDLTEAIENLDTFVRVIGKPYQDQAQNRLNKIVEIQEEISNVEKKLRTLQIEIQNLHVS